MSDYYDSFTFTFNALSGSPVKPSIDEDTGYKIISVLGKDITMFYPLPYNVYNDSSWKWYRSFS